jgi:hypothetical protein
MHFETPAEALSHLIAAVQHVQSEHPNLYYGGMTGFMLIFVIVMIVIANTSEPAPRDYREPSRSQIRKRQ